MGEIIIYTLGGYMNSIFEEIWATSLADTHLAHGGEDERILDILEKYEEKLLDSLGEDMKPIFEEYNLTQNELSAACGKQYFFAGVRFATKYLLEVMYG